MPQTSLTTIRKTYGLKDNVSMRWSLFAVGNPPRAAPQHLIPSKQPQSGRFARVITQIPEPRRHLLFYYGRYANAVRGQRLRCQPQTQAPDNNDTHPPDEPTLSPARRAALRRRWAHLIRRVFEVDPLVCERCGDKFQVIRFITQPRVIRRILDHLKKRQGRNRAPPQQQPPVSE
jgi:hypothetical protein